MIIQIQLRRDTTVNWNNFNPILADGEFGIENLSDEKKKIKIGDGIKRWTQLEYAYSGVEVEDFLNHINNNTDAHGIDTIKNGLDNTNDTVNIIDTRLNNHINNNTTAHGIDTIKSDINNINNNLSGSYNDITDLKTNLNTHINNNSTAHGIDIIKSDINGVKTDLLNTKSNLSVHIVDTKAHGLDDVRLDVDNLETNYTNLYTNVTRHINNTTTAHGIDLLKEDMTSTNTNLQNHINNNNAHGLDIVKSDIVNIKIDIENTNEALKKLSILAVRGSVPTYSDLPNPVDLADGITYIVEADENKNNISTMYTVSSNTWIYLSEFKIDLSLYYTKDVIDEKLENLDIDLDIDLDGYYTKDEIDNKIQNVDLTDYYNKTEVDEKLENFDLENKLDKSDTINSVYGTDNDGNQIMIPHSQVGLINYSLDEQDTGQKWIDGKTIYQKTFTGIIPYSDTTLGGGGLTIGSIDTEFDTLVNYAGYIKIDLYHIPIPYYDIKVSTQNTGFNIYHDRYIYLWAYGHAFNNKSVIFTVWYTKKDSELELPEDPTYYTEGLLFTLINNGTAYSVAKGTATDSNIVIPKTYNNLPVTVMAKNGFMSSTMVSIKIPDSITIIDEGALASCFNLASITIPDNVTSIGNSALSNCTSLTSVIIPNKVISIINNAFYNCNQLMYVVMGGSVTSVGTGAFDRCDRLGFIYYCGESITDWNKISIGNNNYALNGSMRYYYSETNKSGCWHWVNGLPTLW
jgi:hypothetical protein